MAVWSASEHRSSHGGLFQIVVTPPGGSAQDVTFFRGVPTEISSYSSADPFGDATASLRFPSVTAFDERGSGEMQWCVDHALVDIFLVFPTDAGEDQVIEPFGQQVARDYPGDRTNVWEGFFTVFAYGEDGSLNISCQGALFQLDKYRAKPIYPPRPYPNETLIEKAFDSNARPNLKTGKFIIEWPPGWTKVATNDPPNIYTPIGVYPGQKLTGYSTRQTGAWDSMLTGFVQDLLSVMFVDDESGAVAGNQWTVRKYTGRQPVLKVRDRFRPFDFNVVYGTPGVTVRLQRDLTQYANIAFGEGTSTDGTGWRNANIAKDGSSTDYIPLAYHPSIYPAGATNNPNFNKDLMVSESYIRYGSGFPLEQALVSAAKSLQRDLEPGWTGELVLHVDPTNELSRWLIKAGMSVRITHIVGTGEDGIRFHIAEASQSPQDGSVTLRLDTQYRDLLTLEEVQAKVRDPLSPTKLMQVNRRSVTIEDRLAPWDYRAGSGYLPKASLAFFDAMPATARFPYDNEVLYHPPGYYPEHFIRVNGDSPYRSERWRTGWDLPILMGEKGSIRRVELGAYYEDGTRALVSFHFSIYYNQVTTEDMPYDDLGPSPFIQWAFQDATDLGEPFPPGYLPTGDKSIIIGWGDADQRCGFWPGRMSDGYPPTGLFVDEGTWPFDLTQNEEFKATIGTGNVMPVSAYTLYGALYAESEVPVYFLGRMYREEPGT